MRVLWSLKVTSIRGPIIRKACLASSHTLCNQGKQYPILARVSSLRTSRYFSPRLPGLVKRSIGHSCGRYKHKRIVLDRSGKRSGDEDEEEDVTANSMQVCVHLSALNPQFVLECHCYVNRRSAFVLRQQRDAGELRQHPLQYWAGRWI